MATTPGELFIDTNIWLYATNPQSLWHTLATQTLQQFHTAGSTLVTSPQVLREYIAVATRPGVVQAAPVLADILANIALIRARCRMVEETASVVDQLIQVLATTPTAQRRVHDANIVATMQAGGVAHLLTHNTADFAPYAHLITIVPLVPPTM
ncbi:MAG TPA: type II toxin-antitoxin system VapC family toxin [Herpetosiphonaceae bacterium]